MQSGANARALCARSIGRSAGIVSGPHSVARRDMPFRYDLAIDAEITVAEGSRQRLRNGEIAEAGGRIDLRGGAADDALDDLEPGSLSDRNLPPDQIKLVPGRPAAHIEIGAEAQWIDPRAERHFQRRDGVHVDDRNH